MRKCRSSCASSVNTTPASCFKVIGTGTTKACTQYAEAAAACMQIPTRPQELAPLLWVLLGLFVLRVVGQALVAFFDVGLLPPMPEWYSGLLPYRYLLPAQIAIICLMVKVCCDFSRGAGYFANPRRLFARPVL